jgi:hypothetical protein
MAKTRKTPRRQFKSTTTDDRWMRLNFIPRGGFLGQRLFGRTDRYLVIPEPDEELEGSELTDGERWQAVLRERTRREGRE